MIHCPLFSARSFPSGPLSIKKSAFSGFGKNNLGLAAVSDRDSFRKPPSLAESGS
jgi:hypothetical protein